MIGRDVVTSSGQKLGRCHDLAGELTGTGLQVVALCVGRGGYLARLGIGSRTHDEIDWSSVIRIEGNRIVVHDP